MPPYCRNRLCFQLDLMDEIVHPVGSVVFGCTYDGVGDLKYDAVVGSIVRSRQ